MMQTKTGEPLSLDVGPNGVWLWLRCTYFNGRRGPTSVHPVHDPAHSRSRTMTVNNPAAIPSPPAPANPASPAAAKTFGSRNARLIVGEEYLLTSHGTIIPMGLAFPDGDMLLLYHTGFDAWFEPCGMSRSTDQGLTWTIDQPPLYRVAACGVVGEKHALFFDEYIVHEHDDVYSILTNRTRDGGRTFTGVTKARCTIPKLIPTPYVAKPGSPFFPEMPDWYRSHLGDKPRFAATAFGRVMRLADQSLVMACYGPMIGNLPKHRPQGAEASVGAPAAQGVAEMPHAGLSTSSFLLRSLDDGMTWTLLGVCGRLEPNRPFDGGYFFSEGFNETALTQTPSGQLMVVMRHGSYHLLWSNRSDDGGLTWQGIQPMNHAGVAPHMVRLSSGLLAAAWGRPGLTVAFSFDGSGRYWDLATELMRGDEASQRYPWLVPTGPRSLLALYDRRTWKKPEPIYVNHGIYARSITVDLA